MHRARPLTAHVGKTIDSTYDNHYHLLPGENLALAEVMMTRAVGREPILTPGALVRARGRDWVVLPSQEPDVLLLRPLTGGDEEAIGLFRPIEAGAVAPTAFQPPDPGRAGGATAGLLLRDAACLSLRSGAAPFRSLGRISVAPRPYQFVPLIMALRLETVRLLIADDVGVGKTIEAAMIARELLDRGLARRLRRVSLWTSWRHNRSSRHRRRASLVRACGCTGTR